MNKMNKKADFFAIGFMITAIIVYGLAITILSQITEVSVKPFPSIDFLSTYQNFDDYFNAAVHNSGCITLSNIKNIMANESDCKIINGAFSTECFNNLRERWLEYLTIIVSQQLENIDNSSNISCITNDDGNVIECSFKLHREVKGNANYKIQRDMTASSNLEKSKCFNISRELFNLGAGIKTNDALNELKYWSTEKGGGILTLTSEPFVNKFELKPIVLKIAVP